jgi:hypothetical protein
LGLGLGLGLGFPAIHAENPVRSFGFFGLPPKGASAMMIEDKTEIEIHNLME